MRKALSRQLGRWRTLSTLSAIITLTVNKGRGVLLLIMTKIQKPGADRRTTLFHLSPICFACIIQGSMQNMPTFLEIWHYCKDRSWAVSLWANIMCSKVPPEDSRRSLGKESGGGVRSGGETNWEGIQEAERRMLKGQKAKRRGHNQIDRLVSFRRLLHTTANRHLWKWLWYSRKVDFMANPCILDWIKLNSWTIVRTYSTGSSLWTSEM